MVFASGHHADHAPGAPKPAAALPLCTLQPLSPAAPCLAGSTQGGRKQQWKARWFGARRGCAGGIPYRPCSPLENTVAALAATGATLEVGGWSWLALPAPPGAAWMQRGVSGWQWWGCHAVHAELPPAQRLHPAGPRSELCDEPGSVVRAIVGVLGPQAACCCAAVAPETSQSGATGGGGGWHRGTAWLGGGDGGSCCWGSPPCPSPAELLARGDERCGAARGVAWLAAVSCARVSADCACACMPASTRIPDSRWAGTQLLVRLGATGLETTQIVW